MPNKQRPTGSISALASFAGGKGEDVVDGPAHEDEQFRLVVGVPTIESVVAADTAAKGADHVR